MEVKKNNAISTFKKKRSDLCCQLFYLTTMEKKTINQIILCINHSNAFKDYKYKNVICRTIWNK
jgi:hypothetical protein